MVIFLTARTANALTKHDQRVHLKEYIEEIGRCAGMVKRAVEEQSRTGLILADNGRRAVPPTALREDYEKNDDRG